MWQTLSGVLDAKYVSRLEIVQGTEMPRAGDDLHIVRPRSLYERRFKRPFDIVVGTAATVALAPVMGAIGGAIRWRLGKGVLYTQERVGKSQQPFTIYKFRTMRHDRRQRHVAVLNAQQVDRRNDHKADDDPRHTGLGRLLRRISLDELPQLINVLRGEMSLVGPRPEVIDVARERGYLDHSRHQVKPGMTGPYQISKLRENGDLRDGLDMDTEYVNNLTFRNDMRYLVGTVRMIFERGTGS